jgi:phytoene dehydrogenase-like protein
MTGPRDAIVVGAGINGMVAAAELAKAGWTVTLVDGNDRLGGFIDSAELTVPGYRHDTYSSWHPLFVSGAAYAELGSDLQRHGLRYRNTDDELTASVAADGRVTMAYRDPVRTAEGFRTAADRREYLAALAELEGLLPLVGAVLSSDPRSTGTVRALMESRRRLGRGHLEELLRSTAAGGRAWARSRFAGGEVDHLWAPWLLHAGLAPDQAQGGLMMPLLAATLHGVGLPVVEAGAAAFVAAFRGLFNELGVEVRLGRPVEEIVVASGRAMGVRLADDTIWASRAVLASVTPDALYGELLPGTRTEVAGLEEVRRQAGRFRYGRAAMQIHLALSVPPAWRDPRLAAVPLLHLTDGSASTAIACAQAEAGLLPAVPTVVVGRQDVLDPSRVPDGGAALWIQLQELPFVPIGDAAGELDTSRGWTRELASAYAGRVLARIATHAPGLAGTVLGTTVISPVDLAAANPNPRFCGPYGGACDLDQAVLWRPLPSSRSHRTPIAGLWHIGASTHPGAGLGGGSGHLVAQQLTAPPLLRRVQDRVAGFLPVRREM